VDEIVGINNM